MNLGQDTEFFLKNTTTGEFLPAHTYFPIKELAIKPFKAEAEHYSRYAGDVAYYNAFKAFRDGFAVEINTPPQSCRGTMINSMRQLLERVREQIKLPEEIIFSTDPVMPVDPTKILTYPEDLHFLGCNPTLNAYTGTFNQIAADPLTLPFRTSGAHIHLAADRFSGPEGQRRSKGVLKSAMQFIKMCDKYIGLPATYITHHPDEFKRRTLYGRAGEFRFQPWGIEYRVCSTRVLNHHMVYSMLLGMMRYLYQNLNTFAAKYDPSMEEKIALAINTGEGIEEMMQYVLDEVNELEKVINAQYAAPHIPLNGGWEGPETKSVFYNGKMQTVPLDLNTLVNVREIVSAIETPSITINPDPFKTLSWSKGEFEAHTAWPEHLQHFRNNGWKRD